MATTSTPAPASNTVRVGIDLPSITTTTKTDFIGFNGQVLRSTVDANGKPHRIHKVITTTTTVTCFGDDTLASNDDQTPEAKFVEHVKELGVDTKDVLMHTAANVQHALETAGDYLRTQLAAPTTAEQTEKTTSHEQSDFLQQATALKDVIVQKALDVKDATIDVLKDITAPPEQPPTMSYHQGTTTVVTDKKHD